MKKVLSKKNIRIFIAALIAALIVFLCIRVLIDRYALVVNECDVTIASTQSDFKIALIGDLHSIEFGNGNEKIVDKIKNQQPDIIAVVGDITDRSKKDDYSPQIRLLKNLLDIAPVFYTPGNHELDIANENEGNKILDDIRKTGVFYLDEDYTDTVINGQNVRIGGMYDYAFFVYTDEKTWTENSDTYKFLKEFEDTRSPKIMLCHRPDSFVLSGNIGCRFCDVDLILSGHTHGGVMQLPFIGGVYVPDQGLNPEYYHGLYSLKHDEQIVITSGFAGYKFIPRLFNRPEIMIINVLREN